LRIHVAFEEGASFWQQEPLMTPLDAPLLIRLIKKSPQFARDIICDLRRSRVRRTHSASNSILKPYRSVLWIEHTRTSPLLYENCL